MKNIPILFVSFCSICGCSSLNLTMKSPRQFRQLKDIPIYVSTKKEVKVVDANKQTMNVFLDGFYTEKYQSVNDSLILFSPHFSTSVPFSDISEIKCSGLWDDEIGFISRKEFISHDSAMGLHGPLGASIMGSVLGFLGGGYFFVKITDHSELEHTDDWYSYVFGSALIGAVTGATICHKLVESTDRRKIINKIKEERKKGNFQK
jgi:hypothetical protein